MHNVFAYHEGFDRNLSHGHQLVIDHWRRSWAKQGWNPVVLGIEDAKRNPMFKEFDARCRKLPTVNTAEYELACYRRWMAVAAAGGGFMSDYDVINYGFKARKPEAELVIYESATHCNSVVPSVVGGTAYGFLLGCMAFSLPDPNLITSSDGGRAHTSDMVVMQIFDQKQIYNIAPVVFQYGQDGWDTAPLVHYAHVTTERTDRVQCIRTARPL